MWHLSHISGQVVNVTSLQELSLTKLMHCFLSHCQLVPNNIYKIHLCGWPPNWWCACAALMSRRMSAHWKSSWAQPCPSDQLWRNFLLSPLSLFQFINLHWKCLSLALAPALQINCDTAFHCTLLHLKSICAKIFSEHFLGRSSVSYSSKSFL